MEPTGEKETIEREVVVYSVIFHAEESGFTVASMEDASTGERFTAVGSFHSVSPGMPLLLKGKETTHPKYGPRFQIDEYEMREPSTEDGVRRYLESFIHGIGPVMAARIVNRFGPDTMEIIEKEPKRLTEVEGIGKKKADEIIKSWHSQMEIKNVMIFLQGHGVSPGYAVKIYKEYGHDAIEILKENPYVLARDIRGIGFKIADRIAMRLGIDPGSPVRLRAGIAYVLDQATDDGHVFLPEEVLVDKAANALETGSSRVEDELAVITQRGDEVVNDRDRIYLAPYLYFETQSAEKLAGVMLGGKSAALFGRAEEEIRKNFFKSTGFTLDDEQFMALEVLASEKVVILTGGPGTGKTVTTRGVIQMFERAEKKVLLAAPTGRAAKRLSEATGSPAKTIHRLLEFNPKVGGFVRDAGNPLDADLIILDEVSMMDLWLFHHFLRAVQPRTRLLLVGDVDQLPSVGAGSVLRDLIQSNVIKTVMLKNIHRQAQKSAIVVNAHRVNNGEMPVVSNTRKTDFFFIKREEPEQILKTVVGLCADRITSEFGYRPSQIQVISPMYRGPVGVDNLNLKLQEKINPGKDFSCGPRTFRIDDRVMHIRNNYEKDVFNGDVGYIAQIDAEEKTLVVDYADRKVEYGFDETDQLVPAYAITVHKSQGSEYPVVVVVMTTHHYPMLQRNLVYTAITRAREMAIIVGTKKAVAIAVGNNAIEERYTALAERLVERMKKQ
ncbi:MAG: ATP-dependent RecD-like DNA helicase [bacterium]